MQQTINLPGICFVVKQPTFGGTIHPMVKPKSAPKPKLELYPIKRVMVWAGGIVKETYWVVQKPDGTEIQFGNFEAADEYQV